MMETKLWAALWSLLLINSGSADHTGDHTSMAPAPSDPPGTVSRPVGTTVVPPMPDPSRDPVTHGASDSETSVSKSSATAKPEIAATASTTEEDNVSEKGVNPKTLLPSQATSLSTSEGNASTPLPSLPPPTAISSTRHAQTLPVDVPTGPSAPSPSHTASHHPAPLPSDSLTAANRTNTSPSSSSSTPSPTPSSSTVAPTVKPLKPEATSVGATARSTSTSSTASSHQAPTTQHAPTLVPTSESHDQQASKAQPSSTSTSTTTTTTATTTTTTPTTTATTTTTTPTTTATTTTTTTTTASSSPSTQAKSHVDNPSLLNTGEDPTVVHNSPTLDPLLAGLVSAFIITAVIITLLFFLKLRRRDNRPEFRRLQDLPMDDMMEDTPLSLYSY